MKPIICSECFVDEGLKLQSKSFGINSKVICPVCKSSTGYKLNLSQLRELATVFFVYGTFHRTEYGGASIVQFNELQTTDIKVLRHLRGDITLIEKVLRVGFYYYGPPMSAVGCTIPLQELQHPTTKFKVIDRIIDEYPRILLNTESKLYRIRRDPTKPYRKTEYDTPPLSSSGRLNSKNFPVWYGSQDLEICIHECRVTVEDELFVATLSPIVELTMLDLTAYLEEPDFNEFESLGFSLGLLFSSGSRSYDTIRLIAKAAKKKGFDGIIYPSFFGQWTSRVATIPNIAVFGRPIKQRKLIVNSINRIQLNNVKYDYSFGPVLKN